MVNSRMAAGIVIVAVVGVLIGGFMGGFFGGSAPSGNQTQTNPTPTPTSTPSDPPKTTSTPTQTPTPTTTPQPVSSLPGVEQDGISNITALITHHRNTLSGTPRTGEVVVEIEVGAVETRTNTTYSVGDGGYPYQIRTKRVQRTKNVTIVTWGNQTIVAERRVAILDSGQTTLYSTTRATPFVSPALGALSAFLRGNFTADRSKPPYVFRASGETGTVTIRGQEYSVTQREGSIVVSSDGVIQKAEITVVLTGADTTITQSMRYRVTTDPPTGASPPAPAWLSAAQNVQGSWGFDTTPVANGTAIKITNSGTRPIKEGTTLYLTTTSGQRKSVTIQSRIGVGDAVYLHAGSGQQLVLSNSAPDTALQFRSGEYTLTLIGPAGRVLTESDVVINDS